MVTIGVGRIIFLKSEGFSSLADAALYSTTSTLEGGVTLKLGL